MATACAFEQWQQRSCAHERQRRRALLRQQAYSLARQDACSLHRYADDICLEALQRKRVRFAVIGYLEARLLQVWRIKIVLLQNDRVHKDNAPA
jgi:hypothetical protein